MLYIQYNQAIKRKNLYRGDKSRLGF